MLKVTDAYERSSGRVVICDFSPPRGANPAAAEEARQLAADFICVAYNPGKAVRVASSALALQINQATGRDVVFNLAPRDMNKLALQSHLLGAQLLGLPNVLVVQGDPFTPQERERLSQVGDFNATQLIASIRGLNEGLDYRGLKLREACDFCIGASVDLGRGVEHEARLAQRKVAAGTHFLVTQPIFDIEEARCFEAAYREAAGEALDVPVFWGVQVLVADGVIFSNVPQSIRDDLSRGRDGAEIALETLQAFEAAGLRGVYLVPPILRGGARDYAAAARVLAG